MEMDSIFYRLIEIFLKKLGGEIYVQVGAKLNSLTTCGPLRKRTFFTFPEIFAY